MFHRICKLAMSLLMLTGCISAFSQTITYVGSELDLGPGWRDASVAKSFDIDGNNIYGSDGYIMYATTPVGTGGGAGNGGTDLSSLPHYLSLITNASLRASGFGYATINNPIPGGTFSGDIESGLAGIYHPTQGQYATLTTLTMGTNVPKVVRVGFLLDASGGDLPDSIRISGPNGAVAQVAPANTGFPMGNEADYYFFDITGAKPGQIFTISEQPGPNIMNAVIGGLTFDSTNQSVPGPSGSGQVQLTWISSHYEADTAAPAGNLVGWRVVHHIQVTNTGGTSLYAGEITGATFGSTPAVWGSPRQAITPSNPQPIIFGTNNDEIRPGDTFYIDIAFAYQPILPFPLPSGIKLPLKISGFFRTAPPDPVTGFNFTPRQTFSQGFRAVPAPTY